MSFYLSKRKKVDIKKQGSKNYGASNTTILLGKKAGLIVLIHDIFKALIPVLLFRTFCGFECGAFSGAAAVFGHIFPFYLKFDGGKGFASFIGATVACFPAQALISILIALLIAIICNYIVIATFTYTLTMPIIFLCAGQVVPAVVFFICTVVIFYKHKSNIVNLITKNGKEVKLRTAFSKKHD